MHGDDQVGASTHIMALDYQITLPEVDGVLAEFGPIRELLQQLKAPVADLKTDMSGAENSYLRLPGERSDLLMLKSVAEGLQQNFSDVIVLGTGGSSLGAQAMCALARNNNGAGAHVPQLHFPDNLGPHSMTALLDGLDLGTAHFLTISKSGNTAETLAQFYLCFQTARDALVESTLRRHFTTIVGPGDSSLRAVSEDNGIPIYDHLGDLGGRYSAFSLVGLLPAMIVGLDATLIRKGANAVLQHALETSSLGDVPCVLGAAVTRYLSQQKGVSISALMPYDSRLEYLAKWYQQLWAESLGKGGAGTTPLGALGPVDQHSQLQMFLDGPGDKFITLVTEDMAGLGPRINGDLARRYGTDYLADRTIGDLVAAEAQATEDSLISNARPMRRIRLGKLDEESLGALMMNFMLETVLTARLMGVDPFSQPAVEEGKRRTVGYLNETKTD